MIKTSEAYRAAIVGPRRQILLKAEINVVDPDLTYGAVRSTGEAEWSDSDHLHDKVMELGPRYATLETGRWPLDGSCTLIPDDPKQLPGEVGMVSRQLCGEDGVFDPPVWVEQSFAHTSILQACSVYFSSDPLDGVPEDFVVSVHSAGQDIYTQSFTGNHETYVSLDGFAVRDPDAIRITVTKWSLPCRRMRIAEIIPGIYGEWGGDMIASLDIRMLGNFAGLTIPYGTCTLTLNNKSRRFEPFAKSGMFESIEDRQQIPVSMGVKLPDGSTEWVPVGVFYQAGDGWRTGNNDLSLTWQLVDIIGLLANRDFIPPAQLPTTLGGWLQALVDQLGPNFHNKWHADPKYTDLTATVSGPEALKNQKCGAILRFVCMATGTWPRADQETGDLTAEPLWSQGNGIKLSAMPKYPTKKANKELAALMFKLPDGSTEVVSGNSTSSSEALSINNPFIHTREQALTAARQILSQYGGIVMETVSRGDMSSEIGDVDTVWISDSEAKTGRRMSQTLRITNGVLKDAQAALLQADGSLLYAERQVFVASGVFHVPAGVSQVRLILVSGGQGGEPGEDGVYSANPFTGVTLRAGESGRSGIGGKVWSGVVSVNPDSDYQIRIGKGGKSSGSFGTAGAYGEESTFGNQSSESGNTYSPSYTDILSGSAYGRSGVESPTSGTGDGGKGGYGGNAPAGHREPKPDGHGDRFVLDVPPGVGKPGVDGADGVCVIYWKKVK